MGLQSLMQNVTEEHVRVNSENTATVSCINNMGSEKSVLLDDLTKEIWQWCTGRNSWLSCTHIAGAENVTADTLSRKFHTDTEWKLDTSLLHESLNLLNVAPTFDLFASRINHQFPRYVSFQPDPHASAIVAFAKSWSNDVIYCFPPFNLLCKIQRDQAEGMVVAQLWRSQMFWPLLTGMLTATPVLLSHRNALLTQPNDKKAKHP